jgi:hypothetical protein
MYICSASLHTAVGFFVSMVTKLFMNVPPTLIIGQYHGMYISTYGPVELGGIAPGGNDGGSGSLTRGGGGGGGGGGMTGGGGGGSISVPPPALPVATGMVKPAPAICVAAHVMARLIWLKQRVGALQDCLFSLW